MRNIILILGGVAALSLSFCQPAFATIAPPASMPTMQAVCWNVADIEAMAMAASNKIVLTKVHTDNDGDDWFVIDIPGVLKAIGFKNNREGVFCVFSPTVGRNV